MVSVDDDDDDNNDNDDNDVMIKMTMTVHGGDYSRTSSGLLSQTQLALFLLQWQHPKHSGCIRYTSRSETHGIEDMSLNLHGHS